MKELASALVNEAVNKVAEHYNTTPDMVRLAMATGNEKIKAYVISIASGAGKMVMESVQ